MLADPKNLVNLCSENMEVYLRQLLVLLVGVLLCGLLHLIGLLPYVIGRFELVDVRNLSGLMVLLLSCLPYPGVPLLSVPLM